MHGLHEGKPIYLLGVVLLALLSLILIAPAATQDELIEGVWLMEDPKDSLSVEAVIEGNFQPVTNYLKLGYNSSAQWLRLRILPAVDGGEVVVSFRSGAPDRIRFYAQALTELHESGTHVDPGRYQALTPLWPSPIRGFRIDPPDGGGEYFVEIKSIGTIMLNITAQPTAEALLATERTFIGQITYLTAMFFLALWSIQMFTVSRLHLFGWFSAMQLSWLIFNIFYLGYGERIFFFLTTDMVVPLFRLSVFLGAFLTVTFHRSVMSRFEPSWLVFRLFDVQLCVIAASFTIFLTVDPMLGLKITALSFGMSPIVLLMGVTTASKDVAPGLTIMRVIYGVLSLSFLFNALGFLGIAELKLFIIYGYMIHGLTTGLLLFILLHMTSNDIFIKARSAESERIKIEYQNKIEQDKNQSLSGFMHMLGHEAKNAMSVMQMSTSMERITDQQRTRANNAIIGLTGIIDRCNQAARLDNKEMTLKLEKCDLEDILSKLCASVDAVERITLLVQGPAVVHNDPVLLDVLFRNLLDNAIKYASLGSDITVVLKPDTDGYSIMFENEPGAAGMPNPSRVFAKYYRAPRAQDEIGSGLGLYIARRLADLMGGRIDYMPSKRHIRFKVWIPC
ncbi:MAG: ATP-binding protein [Pseudorhodobacter sp.]|nr:ATP-binding protein [Pseudorhodobacter sp.]